MNQRIQKIEVMRIRMSLRFCILIFWTEPKAITLFWILNSDSTGFFLGLIPAEPIASDLAQRTKFSILNKPGSSLSVTFSQNDDAFASEN